ncbi:hypothetical protein BJ912DRAFT_931242 [Pholiota molesta]|nr:hypothetical protein BJ912DRAFT_931242 [Pholiota molesta]
MFHCLRWLVFADEGWKTRKRINWAMLSITIILWALSTTSRALDLRSSMIVVENQTTPAVDPLQSATMLLWMDVLSCTNAAVSTLLADAVLVNLSLLDYLCQITLGRGTTHSFVARRLGAYGLASILRTRAKSVNLEDMETGQHGRRTRNDYDALLGLTIVLNSYATFMIVRRIYLVARESKASVAKPAIHQLQFVMRILIESGSLYLAVAIAQFISWWTPNNGYAIFMISSIVLR